MTRIKERKRNPRKKIVLTLVIFQFHHFRYQRFLFKYVYIWVFRTELLAAIPQLSKTKQFNVLQQIHLRFYHSGRWTACTAPASPSAPRASAPRAWGASCTLPRAPPPRWTTRPAWQQARCLCYTPPTRSQITMRTRTLILYPINMVRTSHSFFSFKLFVQNEKILWNVYLTWCYKVTIIRNIIIIVLVWECFS